MARSLLKMPWDRVDEVSSAPSCPEPVTTEARSAVTYRHRWRGGASIWRPNSEGSIAMKFQILDVGHGFCARLLAGNGNVMLFDCGHKTDPEFRPSDHLTDNGCTGIERLVITNYDEDHISDLPRLQSQLPIATLRRNGSISAKQLRSLKEQSGPISEAMQCLLEMMEGYCSAPIQPPEFPNISLRTYHNMYLVDFTDTNNLSLVSFLQCPGLAVVIPGDLEKPGWEKLLQIQTFRAELSEANVFVASHHGRENGYCEDVFSYCHPDVVVFSDGPKQYATREMVDTYARHARGVLYNGQTWKVMTTRKDGTITWDL